ncbi:MAG TPA: hypothetical protein DCW29_07990 [Janthinobacterium sp.]|nr:hypothetical protein [Janthinobacterium sp.]
MTSTPSRIFASPRAPGAVLRLLAFGACAWLTACGGGGGGSDSAAVAAPGATAVVAAAANTAPMTVDQGPGTRAALNAPYVSVTICKPGTTTCQTIDHVLVDTGSSGLRVLTPLDPALGLPAVNGQSGPAGECTSFVSGYTWGSVKRADVKIGGETAAGISIHVVNDSAAAFASVPRDCSGTGNNLGTVAALGANGILGIGVLQRDCGANCVTVAQAATYYSCGGGACSASTMPLEQQVSNPVIGFPINNNGVVLVLPSVPTGGANSLSGTLIFGIGTQSNNRIGSATVYRTDAVGNINTTYRGTPWTASFFDSGSNALYFSDTSLRMCPTSTGFYCPTAPLTLSATNSAFDGSVSGLVNFTIESVDGLNGSVTAASVGGTNFGDSHSSLNNAFDWGLPFFFGRSVFVAFEGAGAPTPYLAY